MKKKILTFLENIGILIAAFAIYAVVEVGYVLPKNQIHLDHLFFVFAVTLTVLVGMYFVYCWQLSKKNSWNFNTNIVSVKKSDWKKWLWVLAGFVSMIVIQLLGVLLLHGQSTNQAQWITLSKLVNVTWLKVFLIIVAPIFEELIFRGFYFNTFFTINNKVNLWAGIATSGAIFALMHGFPTSWFYLVYWALGMVLSAVYLKTKDLRCNVALHILNNLLVML